MTRTGLLASLSAAALMSALATPALAGPAAVATRIVADTAPGRSLRTTVSQAGALYTIDGGTAVGPNLFHSFSAFSLGTGDTAAWVWTGGDPASITRVINRVTGGGSSFISGTIDSTGLPNADFYFINPAGIVFGQGASVNVRGATYFSTASELRFADGAKFSAATPSGSTLSMASPSAFGFLGSEGDITLNGVDSTFLPGAGALSLSAANITVENASFNAGGLDLFAVGNQAFALPLTSVPAAGALVGDLSVQDATLDTIPESDANGAIKVGGGAVSVAGGALYTQASATAVGGSLTIAAGALTVTSASSVGTETSTGQTAGAISAQVTGPLLLEDGAYLASFSLGPGDSGDVTVRAANLVVQNAGYVNADTFGTGNRWQRQHHHGESNGERGRGRLRGEIASEVGHGEPGVDRHPRSIGQDWERRTGDRGRQRKHGRREQWVRQLGRV